MKHYLISVRFEEGKRIIDATIEWDEINASEISTCAESRTGLPPELQQAAAEYHPFIMRARLNKCRVYHFVTESPLDEVEKLLTTAPEKAVEQWKIV